MQVARNPNIEKGYCHCGCGGRTSVPPKTRKDRGWIAGVPIDFVRGHHSQGQRFAAKPRLEARFELVDGKPCVWIPLTKGKWALIDESDYELVKDNLWHELNKYACHDVKDGQVFMHQVICPCEPGSMPDHINGDKLDNRRSNLRTVTKAQNAWNAKISRRNTSGYKGVKQHSKGGWQADIMCNGEKKYLGLFPSKDDAIAARSAAERRLFGEYRRSEQCPL